MNREVERAKEALAAGRRDEASVHAWNALTTAQGPELEELYRIGEDSATTGSCASSTSAASRPRPRPPSPSRHPAAAAASRGACSSSVS